VAIAYCGGGGGKKGPTKPAKPKPVATPAAPMPAPIPTIPAPVAPVATPAESAVPITDTQANIGTKQRAVKRIYASAFSPLLGDSTDSSNIIVKKLLGE
jgi:hypothetical protein